MQEEHIEWLKKMMSKMEEGSTETTQEELREYHEECVVKEFQKCMGWNAWGEEFQKAVDLGCGKKKETIRWLLINEQRGLYVYECFTPKDQSSPRPMYVERMKLSHCPED